MYLRLYLAPVLRKWLTPAAWVAAITALLLLLFPVGFPNYDTIYALVWGRELAHGVSHLRRLGDTAATYRAALKGASMGVAGTKSAPDTLAVGPYEHRVHVPLPPPPPRILR